MRLIDADAMKKHYPIMENDFGMVFNDGLHKELDGEPTVKAIPLDRVEQIKQEVKEWYWNHDIQELAKDPCVVDAMTDMFIRMLDKALKEQSE